MKTFSNAIRHLSCVSLKSDPRELVEAAVDERTGCGSWRCTGYGDNTEGYDLHELSGRQETP